MYLDQLNEIVLCAANCAFTGASENCSTSDPDCGVALVIGPDATTTAGGQTPVIAQFNQGIFTAAVTSDIQFDTNASLNPCQCRVALGGGMFDITTGAPSTNNQALLSGEVNYGAPQLGNAASFQGPLTLAPGELGLATNSTVTVTYPGAAGLKLRVECSGTGKAKLVALAGTSSTETVLADGIGGGVANCP